jgi:hypothetical protein
LELVSAIGAVFLIAYDQRKVNREYQNYIRTKIAVCFDVFVCVLLEAGLPAIQVFNLHTKEIECLLAGIISCIGYYAFVVGSNFRYCSTFL